MENKISKPVKPYNLREQELWELEENINNDLPITKFTQVAIYEYKGTKRVHLFLIDDKGALLRKGICNYNDLYYQDGYRDFDSYFKIQLDKKIFP